MQIRTRHSVPMVALCSLISAAYGQTAATDTPEASGGGKADQIVITGSYFAGPKAQKTTLETISVQDIAQSAQPSLMGILAQLPATQGNLVTGDSNDTNNSPVAAINLRGLGPRATLVLLNGQRQVSVSEPGGQDSFAVDINTLVPSVLVQRVEVLKDGASALYGSDAVAGVVNFITRKNLEGIAIDASFGALSAKGRKNERVGVGFGTHGDKTAVIGGFEYSHQDQIFTTDVFDAARIAKFGQTSAFANPGTYFVNGVAKPDPLCGSASIGGSPIAGLLINGKCRQDLTLNRGMVAENSRIVGYLSVDHDLTDTTTLKAEFGAAHVALMRDNHVGYPVNTATVTVPAANPGNPFGADAVMNLRFGAAYLGNAAVTSTNSDTFRTKLGIDGKFGGGWNYSVSAAYGLNQTSVINGGYSSISRLQAALNCKGGPNGNLCFNPFASSYTAAAGSALANSQTVLDWLTIARFNDSRYSLVTYDGLITGNLLKMASGEAVKLAVGVQRRAEHATNANDPESMSNDVSFGGPTVNYSVGRSVDAMFAELRVPVSPSFEVDIAARDEKINVGGASFNPKIGFNWNSTQELSFAGSVGRSQRDPGLLQYIGQSGLINIANDPITHSAQNGVALAIQPSTGLSPETSVNSNLGVIWNHRADADQFNVSLDFFQIDFSKLITGTDVVALLLANPTGPAVRRDPVSGQIQLITVPGFVNANKLKLAGLDFNFKYSRKLSGFTAWGSFDGTLMNKYQLTTANGVATDELATYNTSVAPVPKLAARLSTGLSFSDTDVTLAANYKSKIVDNTPGVSGVSQAIPYTTFDLSASHRLGKGTTVTVGAINLLNKLPPGQGNSIYTANGIVYPLNGRSFSVSARSEF